MKATIPDHLLHHAQVQPDQPALEYLGEPLTYAQLLDKTQRLAACLIKLGVARGDRVGIHLDKSLETGISLHGILFAGAAYVPLDAAAPAERIATMIGDCGINVIISGNGKLRKLLSMAQIIDTPLTVIGVDPAQDQPFNVLSWQQVWNVAPLDAPPAITEQDLAYIIYTSGSTGTPKGIMHSHGSSLAFAVWAAQEYGLQTSDRLGNHAVLNFDISIFDFIAGVVAGACTVFIPEEHMRFPASYSALLEESGVTVLFTVPFALVQLCQRGTLEQRDLSRLRWIIFGGEPMPAKYLQQLQSLLPEAQLDNMYGPAEVNGVSHYTITAEALKQDTVPIGPINQISEALIVDEHGHAVANGCSGELLVSTPSMMRGYWGRNDLNEQAFHVSTVEGSDPRRYYRTGDLVRRDDSGKLWFLGRKDRQVKVRSYRVELDEIEAVMTAHPGVEESAAYVVEDIEGVAEINASIIATMENGATRDAVLSYLKERLPPYALPRSVNVVQSFPRTVTGKIDRRAMSGER